ncbi:hypothetical protein EDB81DRAFT_951410 [Dactylonectria macrodidyma]|uniref:NADH:flavin oxidoreductase/NADH oxidase N-terminal domain-containing protein n=1 Tax=Dactylonectria macrodidyma TaxID=307937 RepID=A0A9P9DSV3_9HYPO|nr:hypothetical protein EDB81DRAFT_951410 [Dactylonectria macrodidyma]
MSNLLQSITLGGSLLLRNRVCMGSMTRNRCIWDNKPTEASIEHYKTRARDGVGLIIAEGTFISINGSEWPHAPVMYLDEHADAWKAVTDAVHQEEGKIFFQPWHPGRIQHEGMPQMQASGYPVYAPSPIPAAGGKFRHLEGIPGHTTNITEIKKPQEIIEQYRRSVTLAKKAGFDGIELLSQGGYLLHNFLGSPSNQRKDQYGGSVENRCRFPLEVLDAILDVWPSNRVGIKICPSDDYNDSAVSYAELSETYRYYITMLMKRNLAYINLSRRGCEVSREHDDYFRSKSRPEGMELPRGYEALPEFGDLIKFPGSQTMLMVNHEYTVAEADEMMKVGKIDMITFGRPFIYNPDLISRIKKGVPFATNSRGGKVNYGPYKDANEYYNDWPAAEEIAATD